MIFMFILMVSLVAVVGVAMFVSRTASHGEARFDSETGKTIKSDTAERDKAERDKDAVPATRNRKD